MSDYLYGINYDSNSLILDLAVGETYQLSTFGIPMINWTAKSLNLTDANNNPIDYSKYLTVDDNGLIKSTVPCSFSLIGTVNDGSKVTNSIRVNSYTNASSISDITNLVNYVNNGGIEKATNIKLTSDIDLSSISNWTPIGTITFTNGKYKKNMYNGVFDGNGHTISGLNIIINSNNISYSYCAGLFGYIGSSSIIRNLTVKGTITIKNSTKFQKYIGGIVAYNSGGTVYNCNSNVVIVNDAHKYTGGICGYNSLGYVKKCTNNSDITSYDYTGGIIGYNNGVVSDCTNNGTINGNDFTGGILGYTNKDISNCVNNKNINSSKNAGKCVGGIAGYLNKGIISGCNNYADVFGVKYYGSIVGYNGGTIE